MAPEHAPLRDPDPVQQSVKSAFVGARGRRAYAHRKIEDPTRLVEDNLSGSTAETPGLV
jgi:hypothetical protein